jgi:starvation-inducible DNA-binding protein
MADPSGAATGRDDGLPSSLGREARRLLTKALNSLIADIYALELETLGCSHLASGLHSPSVRQLLEQHASAMHASVRKLADRLCRMGGDFPSTLSDLAKHQRITGDTTIETVHFDRLARLLENNQQLSEYICEVHALFELHGDVTGARLIAALLEEAEQRSISLFQMSKRSQSDS